MGRRGNRPSIATILTRAWAFSAAPAVAFNPALTSAVAADSNATSATIDSTKIRFLSLGIGKSVVIDLPRDAKDVLVADPKIANAVIRSPQRAYIIGSGIGQTNVVFFDGDGQQIAGYDIAVKRDLNGVRAALKQLLPNATIVADGVGEGVMLTGTVATPIEAQQAGDV